MRAGEKLASADVGEECRRVQPKVVSAYACAGGLIASLEAALQFFEPDRTLSYAQRRRGERQRVLKLRYFGEVFGAGFMA